MIHIKRGIIAKKKHKKILKKAKGYYSARSKIYRVAIQAVNKGYQYAYRDRKQKKRKFRQLWIIRINAISRKYGIKYSLLIHKLKILSIKINRKILSNIAFTNEEIFSFLIKKIIKKKNEQK